MAEKWEQLRGETREAYACFVVFRDMEADGRTLAEASRRLGRNISAVKRHSARWDWWERVRLFDVHNEAIARRAAERERARQIAVWERRRLKDLEADHAIGERATTLAAEALESKLSAKISTPMAMKLATFGIDVKSRSRDEALYDPELDGFDPTRATPEQAREYQDRMESDRAARRKVQVSRGDD